MRITSGKSLSFPRPQVMPVMVILTDFGMNANILSRCATFYFDLSCTYRVRGTRRYSVQCILPGVLSLATEYISGRESVGWIKDHMQLTANLQHLLPLPCCVLWRSDQTWTQLHACHFLISPWKNTSVQRKGWACVEKGPKLCWEVGRLLHLALTVVIHTVIQPDASCAPLIFKITMQSLQKFFPYK